MPTATGRAEDTGVAATADSDRLVDAPSLGRIVGLPDDGLRNYLVTLAYYDLSRMVLAYTHSLDDVDVNVDVTGARLVELADEATARFRGFSDEARAGRQHSPVVLDDQTGFEELLASANLGLPVPNVVPGNIDGRPLNANFCTFAIWPSLSVGRDIRNQLLPYRLQGSVPDWLRPAVLKMASSMRGIHQGQLADRLGEGQRIVLWEIGLALLWLLANPGVLDDRLDTAVADALTALRDRPGIGQPEVDAINRALAKGDQPIAFDLFRWAFRNPAFPHLLCLDPVTNQLQDLIGAQLTGEAIDRPGADHLRPVRQQVAECRPRDLWLGLASYHLARRFSSWSRQADSPDDVNGYARLAAQMVLRGNILIVSYEQQRIQMVLDYPARDFGTDFILDRLAVANVGAARGGSVRRLVYGWVQDSVADPMSEIWQRLVTDQLLTVQAGDELLRLGRDIPIPPGQATFLPPQLQEISDDWLDLLMRRYDHSFGDGHGTQARVWWNYNDRMSFIVNFMRSHAQVAGMFRPPFDDRTLKSLRDGRAPRRDRS